MGKRSRAQGSRHFGHDGRVRMTDFEDDIKIIKELFDGTFIELKRITMILENLNQRIGELENETSTRTNRPHQSSELV